MELCHPRLKVWINRCSFLLCSCICCPTCVWWSILVSFEIDSIQLWQHSSKLMLGAILLNRTSESISGNFLINKQHANIYQEYFYLSSMNVFTIEMHLFTAFTMLYCIVPWLASLLLKSMQAFVSKVSSKVKLPWILIWGGVVIQASF